MSNTPSDIPCESHENQSNIGQLLSTNRISELLTSTNIISSQMLSIRQVSTHDNLSRRQLVTRRKRRQTRRMLQEKERRRAERQRRRQHQQECQQGGRQQYNDSYHGYQPSEYWESVNCSQDLNEQDIQLLLEIYDWEKMGPKERWEQEEVNRIEKYHRAEQLALIKDELEQDELIEAMIRDLEEEEEELRRLC